MHVIYYKILYVTKDISKDFQWFIPKISCPKFIFSVDILKVSLLNPTNMVGLYKLRVKFERQQIIALKYFKI